MVKTLVRLETFSPPEPKEDKDVLRRSHVYRQVCLLHSLEKGEAPFSAVQMFKDATTSDPVAIEMATQACFAWFRLTTRLLVYTDLGISADMQRAIDLASILGLIIEMRALGDKWDAELPEHLATALKG